MAKCSESLDLPTYVKFTGKFANEEKDMIIITKNNFEQDLIFSSNSKCKVEKCTELFDKICDYISNCISNCECSEFYEKIYGKSNYKYYGEYTDGYYNFYYIYLDNSDFEFIRYYAEFDSLCEIESSYTYTGTWEYEELTEETESMIIKIVNIILTFDEEFHYECNSNIFQYNEDKYEKLDVIPTIGW